MSHLDHSKQNHYNPLIDSLYKSIKPRRSPNVFLKMIPVHTAHSRGFIYIFVFIQKTNILQLLIIYNYANKIQSFMLTTITNSNPVLWSFCYFNSGTLYIKATVGKNNWKCHEDKASRRKISMPSTETREHFLTETAKYELGITFKSHH